MKKHTISKMFLYRHRFQIGYLLLGLLFVAMLTILPLLTPRGLSEAEMESVVTSQSIHYDTILEDNIVDLPYHILQKASIRLFGLTIYSIKLPSIILGGVLGVLFILLLNRWFKNNVAIMASILAVLSSSFLFIAGSGTPLIMVVFWPTLLFWLGSKIQGENKPKPLYSFIFAFALLFSLFTPYMIYLAIFIVLYALFHPHLRFTITHLPKIPFLLSVLIVLGVGYLFIMNALRTPGTIPHLFFMDDFSWHNYLSNIKSALLPFFQWSGMVESTFLAPLIGLASLALAITGLISTYHGFFASRNSIATYLIIFTVAISGFNPDCAILLVLPLAILIAHGFRYILNKWYGLFPENPYARVFGILPIAVFLSIMIMSDISHFVFGYRYNPAVANEFTNDLSIIRNKVEADSTLIVNNKLEYDFYSILENDPIFNIENTKKIIVKNELPASDNPIKNLVTLGHIEEEVSDGVTPILSNYTLLRIVTNSKSQNSDRLYFYEPKI
ncbi:glycosyltransferase family 39 protein [Candidatus Saccharibacteria bacterium]|nr:glycosyltransferase family 39 protein [Candidatus Saccharibacteria bacterium]